MAEPRRRRAPREGDGLDGDFGPGFDAGTERPAGGRRGGGRAGNAADAPGDAARSGERDDAAGFAAGIPCGKDGCFLKPLGDLATRFALELSRRGHADSATRAATSGIELLKALRDFLDEEIAFAERAAEARRSSARYTKIPVE